MTNSGNNFIPAKKLLPLSGSIFKLKYLYRVKLNTKQLAVYKAAFY